jgi:ABC-2 type transport system permease protein
MSTSTPGPVLLFLSTLSALTGHTLRLLFYLGAGLFLFGVSARTLNIASCLTIFALSIMSAMSIGIVAAAVQLAIHKGSAVLWLFSSASWLTTGALFPLTALPGPVRAVAQWIPLTHSLQGMRSALLQGARLPSLLPEISVLALFSLVLLPSSLWLFSWTLRRARLQGTLSYY